MALNVPGPVAVARLVGGGALAIKIEPPWGDPLETLCKPWYDELHLGVAVERIDLKTADGTPRLKQLLADTHVFLARHRHSALARPVLAARPLHLGSLARPRQHRRRRGESGGAGHDLTYQARAGLLPALGVEGRNAMPLTLVADMVGAERAHATINEVARHPGSSRVVGLYDALRDLAAPLRHGLTATGGHLGGGNAVYGIYAAREGAIAVTALEPHFRARLYEGLGLPDGADPSALFATKTAIEWEQWAASRDLPLVAVKS